MKKRLAHQLRAGTIRVPNFKLTHRTMKDEMQSALADLMVDCHAFDLPKLGKGHDAFLSQGDVMNSTMTPLLMDADNQVIKSRPRRWQEISKSIKAIILVGSNLEYFLGRAERGLANLKRGKEPGIAQSTSDEKEATLKEWSAFHGVGRDYLIRATALWRQYEGKGKGLMERVFKKQLSLKQAHELLKKDKKMDSPAKKKANLKVEYRCVERVCRSFLRKCKMILDAERLAQFESRWESLAEEIRGEIFGGKRLESKPRFKVGDC